MIDKRDIAFNIIEDMTEEELQAFITLFGKGMDLKPDLQWISSAELKKKYGITDEDIQAAWDVEIE